MITAKLIQHSIRIAGQEILTYELEYPRFIHSELMTHRVFSRNAASSRAIPIAKMLEQIEANPARPVHWGLNQAGMQANSEHSNTATCEWTWQKAANSAAESARSLQALGLHKQIVNRVLEPFQMMKTVVTSTEWENFFELRNHEDAQPEIHELASVMLDAYKASTPKLVRAGQWHVPYVDRFYQGGTIKYFSDGIELSVEDALMVSSSCCAQVSYRKNDTSIEKAKMIYGRLVDSKPVHASPFEHQATPTKMPDNWSGNFKGWEQHRKVLGL